MTDSVEGPGDTIEGPRKIIRSLLPPRPPFMRVEGSSSNLILLPLLLRQLLL